MVDHRSLMDALNAANATLAEVRASLAAEYEVRKHVLHALHGEGLPRVMPDAGHGVIQDAYDLYQRWWEARAELTAIEAACLAVARDNNPAVVGEHAVVKDAGRFVVLDEDGDPLIDANTPAELIAQMNGCWTRTGAIVEAQAQKLYELQAELTALRQDANDAAVALAKAQMELEAYRAVVGMRVVADPAVPPNVVEFRQNGRTLARLATDEWTTMDAAIGPSPTGTPDTTEKT